MLEQVNRLSRPHPVHPLGPFFSARTGSGGGDQGGEEEKGVQVCIARKTFFRSFFLFFQVRAEEPISKIHRIRRPIPADIFSAGLGHDEEKRFSACQNLLVIYLFASESLSGA